MGTHYLPIKLLGTSFQLKTDEDLDYLKEIVDFFSRKIEETESKIGLQDPLKVALITGIVLSDELYKERLGAPVGGQDTEVNRITKNLIEEISKAIDESGTLTRDNT